MNPNTNGVSNGVTGNGSTANANNGLQRWNLLELGENADDNIPWVQRFDKWASRYQIAHWSWRDWRIDGNGDWVSSLQLGNVEDVAGMTGQGSRRSLARANLVRQLNEADPPVFTRPARPEYRSGN